MMVGGSDGLHSQYIRIDIFLYFVSSVFQSILPTFQVKTVAVCSRARLASSAVEHRYQKLRFETNTFDWRCNLNFLFQVSTVPRSHKDPIESGG